MYEISKTGSGSPNPHVTINNDYNTYEKNNYTARPPTFNGDFTEFEWWKTKMQTHILGLDDELWEILEVVIDIAVNGVRMVTDRKSITLAKKRLIGNIIELMAFWQMLYLTLSTSKLFSNLLLKPFLNPYVRHMKDIKQRLISWFNNMNSPE